jgi:MoxR-like ATPase
MVSNEIKESGKKLNRMKNEIKKAIIGQEHVIDAVIKCLICNGHALFEGVPGIAKTFLVKVLTHTIEGAVFKRIQFTPDLLPADIIGVSVYSPEKGFYVEKGPIFANLILADEINRTPPKVQSAMLQAMEEREVTIGKQTFPLPKPFFVLATQNPLEQKGVYPLAVAQVDRFLFKIFVEYPKAEEEFSIIDSNAELKTLEDFGIKKVLTAEELVRIQEIVKNIKISEEVKDYILDIVQATRYPEKFDIELGKYIQWGGSPRATIFLALAAKANALMNERNFVTPQDVKTIAPHVLRHRIILNYEGKAKGIRTDEIIEDILSKVPVP